MMEDRQGTNNTLLLTDPFMVEEPEMVVTAKYRHAAKVTARSIG
jgi:hypothetical protein